MPDPDEHWWRGVDSALVDVLTPGSRVLDVGCGDGGLVRRLTELGFAASGVDPVAPERPQLIRQRVEDLDPLAPFDAACAVMSLHHADLALVIPAIARLLRPGGRLIAYELAWEAYDERASAWLQVHDSSGADNSVAGWQLEHAALHAGSVIRAAICTEFTVDGDQPSPCLARTIRMYGLEAEERARIEAGSLPAVARTWVATRNG